MPNDEKNTTDQNANEDEEQTIDHMKQQWDAAQCILNIKIQLLQMEEIEIEHTQEEAQIGYEKINTLPIANRVDVNA